MLRQRFAPFFMAIVVVGFGTAGVALAPPSAALNLDQYIEVAQCDPPTSQDCKQIPQVPFTAGDKDKLQVTFTANANHCSDIEVRILVDNYPQSGWLRVGPGQSVTSPTFTQSGDHVLGVAARGVTGGCNTGVLNAWGGTVHVTSVGAPPPSVGAGQPASGPVPVGPTPNHVCQWKLNDAVVIDLDNGIQVHLDQWHDLTAIGPAHLYAPGATVESDRGDVIGAGGQGNDVNFTIVWFDKKGQHVETNDFTGSIDPEFGALRGTTTNNAGVTNQWSAHEHWTCG